MRFVKLFVSVVTMALIATALLGAGSASATVLCELEEETCSLESSEPAGQAISSGLAPETNATFVSGLWTITCKKSTLAGKSSAESGEPLPVSITELSFAECKNGMTECTVTAQKLPYESSLAYTEAGNGTLTLEKNSGGGEPGAEVVCGSLKCTYSGKPALDALGGQPAEVLAKEEALTKTAGGFLCPTSATMTATYRVSSPEPLYVAQAQAATNTVLCKAKPTEKNGTLECGGQEYAGKIEGKQPGTFTSSFDAGGGEVIQCTKGTLEGEFKKDGTSVAKKGITSLAFESAGGVCTSTLAGEPNVEVKFKKLPYDKTKFVYLSPKPSNGAIPVGKNDGAAELFIDIEGTKCNFSYGLLNTTVINGGTGNTVITLEFFWVLQVEQPKACPGALLQKSLLEITQPGGKVYVAEK